ncbi:ABC transporter permease [Paenibacillus puldeungensis]|uniref:ABC transporter permease n=1 Tax=Paenibacillus puldeungensis TaxID=696536 RepID=A0ABW3RRC8_9BACL
MKTLIKLELKRNKLKPYYIALAVIFAAMTGFLYMIATITKVEHEIEFMNYENILRLHRGVAFIVFTVFSVVIYAKFIIEDYSQKRALLLFSYPVSRSKMFMAKLVLVVGFITFGYLLSTIVPNALFFLTESLFPILSGHITLTLVLSQIINAAANILAIISVSFIALRIGFIHKSVSTTIVTAIILSAVLGNVLTGLGVNIYVLIGVILLFAIGLIFAFSTSKQIKEMEV